MTERDDKLSRRYRELGADEPPAALDQAILAAARRAVAPRTASQRWAAPVSLAAVLVLAVGVTLNLQHEKPGIETSPPNEYSVPQAAPAPEPVQKRVEADDARQRAAAPAPRPASEPPAAPPADKASELRRDATPAPTAKLREKKDLSATMEQPVQKPQPKAFADAAPAEPVAQAAAPSTITSANVAPPPAPSAPAAPARVAPQAAERFEAQRAAGATSRMQEAPADTLKAKREAASADLAKEVEPDPRVRELERIATLRREGRHAEADAALEKFRRDNPGYKIPDTIWERVKPR